MKRPKLTKLTVRRMNQRRHCLPHETTGCHVVLLKADKRTFVVKEHKMFQNYAQSHETFVPGCYTHYIVLPNWLR